MFQLWQHGGFTVMSKLAKWVTVCSYHITYAFQSESALYSCLNVKKLLARSRRVIWSLSDCNWTRQNHLVRKRTLNHLAKLTKWLRLAKTFWPNGWVFVNELSDSGFESSCSHLRKMSHLDFRWEITLCLLKLSKVCKKMVGGVGKFLTCPMISDLMESVIWDSLPHKADAKYVRKMPVLCAQNLLFACIQTRMLSILKSIIEDKLEYLVHLCLVILVNYSYCFCYSNNSV